MRSQCAPLQDSASTSAATCMTESIKDRRVGFNDALAITKTFHCVQVEVTSRYMLAQE